MQILARDIYLHIRRAHAYQIGLQELFDGHNSAERHIWKAITLSRSQGVATQAAVIRDYLGVSFDQQTAWKSDEQALKEWRNLPNPPGLSGCLRFSSNDRVHAPVSAGRAPCRRNRTRSSRRTWA